MSEKLPSREQAIEFLAKNKCSPRVIRHCEAVADLAVHMAENCKKKGLKVDIRLIEIGALLHDVGRSQTQTVNHAIVGANIAESAGFPSPLVSIIKTHVGAGITPKEAQSLGWPNDTYMPLTLEQKIVCYADKLIEGSRRMSIQLAIDKLCWEKRTDAAERVKKLHEEMTQLIGDYP